jgi:regulatory protein
MSGHKRRRAADEWPGGRSGEPTSATGDDGPDADPETVARTIALRKLAAAPQTRAQLDDAMARRGVPDEVRARVLDRFGDVGLIDDATFARTWVESRHAGRGLARKALAHELRRRGVDTELVDEAVAELPPEQEEAKARELVARKLASTRGLDAAARTRRLAGMLARKGYPAGLAYRVIREALETEGVDADSLPPDAGW